MKSSSDRNVFKMFGGWRISGCESTSLMTGSKALNLQPQDMLPSCHQISMLFNFKRRFYFSVCLCACVSVCTGIHQCEINVPTDSNTSTLVLWGHFSGPHDTE